MVLTAVDNLARRRTAVEDSDDDDDDMKMMTTKRGGRRRVIVEDDEDSEEEQENEATLSIVVVDEEEEAPSSSRDREAARPPRPAAGPSRPAPPKQQAPRRRRRRSSARFLRLTGRYDGEEAEDEDEATFAQNDEHLGEMYKRAIRMNAENRINAGNSWGLRLIENIDKFLVDEEAETQDEAPTEEQEKRVNFTKASCTLDASVKIYSYRVDDVHLTSYKVLANLNRTETGKKKDSGGGTQEGDDDETQQTTTQSNERRGTTETLESNVANINISKLDSAYDIDPLFHKMSKTFDEGGAKGLLLVNLGVGSSGCNIVFDSKEQAASIAQDEKEEEPEESTMQEGMIDISSLNTKLESMLNGASVESIPLVPQLRDLRHEYEQLEAEGFVDHNIPKTRSRRYAASQDEEKEAEMSIHQEAMERSRASQVTFAQHEAASQGGDSFAPDDFGGGDDDDDFGFTDFVAADENGARYSSISFQDEGGGFIDDTPPGFETQQPNTSVLLDAICSSNALGGNNDYEFFDAEKLTTGNVWAGAAHWKKTERLRRNKQETVKKKKAKSKKKKTTTKRGTLVDLSKPPCLDDVLHAPPKSKRGTDPLQLSKAMKTKYAKQDNLLPPDAGIGIEQLSTLFLRPNTVLGSKGENDEDTHGGSKKTVGFNTTVESFGGGFDYGGDDDSFGGGDDGVGFELADSSNDDFVINELEGVRKVDKIKVGYATVAKKVDVKRLKKDLWSELETSFAPAVVEEKDPDEDASMDENKPPETPVKKEKSLSFKNTVRDMEASQSQGDVTLPFYFICLLHLANEKGLRLESTGLEDFTILQEADAAPSFGTIPATEPRKARAVATYNEEMLESSSSSDEEETESETSE